MFDTKPDIEQHCRSTLNDVFQKVMRVITLNANGIRAAAKKGFFRWVSRQRADVVCLQETKAQVDQLTDPVFHPKTFHCYYHSAQRKGYSGVAVFSRTEPDDVVEGLGWSELDHEGRYLEVKLGRLSVVSLYAPSGTSGDERQAFKYKFMDRFLPYLKRLAKSEREYIICGDWNIAHKNIDLKNWRSNRKNSGFLPEERQWMDKVFSSAGFVDAFRIVNDQPEQYTWWSNRGQSWDKNVGWRIDYQIVTQGLSSKVRGERIYKSKRFSDHAPLVMDYDW